MRDLICESVILFMSRAAATWGWVICLQGKFMMYSAPSASGNTRLIVAYVLVTLLIIF